MSDIKRIYDYQLIVYLDTDTTIIAARDGIVRFKGKVRLQDGHLFIGDVRVDFLEARYTYYIDMIEENDDEE